MKLFTLLSLSLCLAFNALAAGTPGLNYNYYEGTWSALPNFFSMAPLRQGVSSNIDLTVAKKTTSYSLLWSGAITITTAGDYTFETVSDDGSKLYIGNFDNNVTPLVNNNGLHASKSAAGTIHLNAGTYPITIAFFQNDGGQTMELYWSSNTGIPRQKVPNNVLSHTTSPLTFSYYEGNWSSLPDFSKTRVIKTGIAKNIDLAVRAKDTGYAIVWKGYITIPANDTYTFETNSDDGSKMVIAANKTVTVTNDGLHAAQSVTTTADLTAGTYPVTISFFQNGGGQSMAIYWSSKNGLSRQPIPDIAFTTLATNTAITNTTNTPVAVVADTTTQSSVKGLHTYYFSSTNGDDSRSNTQAQNPLTPWKTIDKLNSFFPSLLPGDAVLFKSGDVFTGTINVSKSGANGLPITFSAYGSGDKPLINGFNTVTGWQSVGGNIYRAPLAAGVYLNDVTINNQLAPMGRYPNADYLTIDAATPVNAPAPVFTGPGTFTDAQLPASITNWTGAEAVIRKNVYILDRCLITGHNGTTISYLSPSTHTPEVGYGYFIQNSLKTLDAEGEWYYDAPSANLYLYTNSNPNSLTVKGSVLESLVTADNKNNLVFDNLRFEGADTSVFNIVNGCSNITIQKCDIRCSGMDVLHGVNSNYLTFSDNNITETNSSPVQLIDCSHTLIKNNSLRNQGLSHGMGQAAASGRCGIYIKGTYNTIANNRIDSSGYMGIMFTGGDSLLVKNNYVSNFCMVVADGGGIYTNADDGFVGRQIIGNIVTDGVGSYKGTLATAPRAASGIYIDELGAQVEVRDNTVYNCVANGIYLHQAYNNIVRNNTVVDNKLSAISMVDDESYTARIRNIRVVGNKMYAKTATETLINQGSTTNDLAQFGTFDSNYYSRPFDVGSYIQTQYKNQNDIYSFYDIKGWNGKYNDRDINSREEAPIKAYPVTKVGTNRISGGTFDNNTGIVSSDGNANVTLDKKLDGNAAKFTNNGSATDADLYSFIDIGAVTAGTTFRIKFSLLGSTNTQNFMTYIRACNDPYYPIVSPIKFFALRTTRTECEYLYTATEAQPDVKLTLVASGKMLPFWIDNVEVTPVDVTYTNIDDNFKFDYNATNTAKTVALDGTYTDITGASYSNTITIQPFGSILLKKVVTQSTQSATTTNETRVENAAIVTENIKTTEHYSVYPNPAVNTLTTKISSEKKGAITVIVHDEAGRVIQASNESKTEVLFEKTFNVNQLHPGLYYMQVKFNDGTSLTKSFLKN